MKNGYNIFWTDFALAELRQTIEYLEEHWTEKELRNFASKLENTIRLISSNPELFQKSEKKNVRRAVVARYNTLYYRIKAILQKLFPCSQIGKVPVKEKYNLFKNNLSRIKALYRNNGGMVF